MFYMYQDATYILLQFYIYLTYAKACGGEPELRQAFTYELFYMLVAIPMLTTLLDYAMELCN